MTTSRPQPPTIIVNNPPSNNRQSRSITPTSPIRSRATPPRIPTPPTASLTRHSVPKHCYLCDEQNPGDFSPTTKYLDACLLCNRQFCPIHKANAQIDTPICNINHSVYYHECLEEARQYLATQAGHESDNSATSTSELDAEELLIQDGVFPSLGEREKAIFTRSPVSDDKLRQLAEYRSLDAEMSGTKGQKASSLIETKELVGADIAV